jgi:Kae1-associated kinase Bud32
MVEIGRGAEAIITLEDGRVRKWRRAKSYRVPGLDERIRRERTIREARIISEARRCGVATPVVFDVSNFELVMEFVDGVKLKDVIDPLLAERIGELVGRIHTCGIIHGDLTTSNMILYKDRIYLIDFGLAFHDRNIESQGVDVHVFFQTLKSTHDNPDILIKAFKTGYLRFYNGAEKVLERVSEIEARGRYL